MFVLTNEETDKMISNEKDQFATTEEHGLSIHATSDWGSPHTKGQ